MFTIIRNMKNILRVLMIFSPDIKESTLLLMSLPLYWRVSGVPLNLNLNLNLRTVHQY
jgi:hypothetical protein